MSREKRKRSNCLLLLTCSSVITVLLLCTAAAGISRGLPGQAERIYGPPSPNLSATNVLLYSFLLVWEAQDLSDPVNPGGEDIFFRVEQGESTPSITGRLYEVGLIPNPGAFRTFLVYSGLDTTIQAGDYMLSPGMPPVEIARALQDATPTHVNFGVLPGWRLEEIAAVLPTSGLDISPDAFLSAVKIRPEGYSFSPFMPESSSLEGFLLPGVYFIERTITLEEMLKTMLDNFEIQVTEDMRNGYQRQGLNLYEAVILASIVEREAVAESDMPLIASVFYNRLAIGMKLDSDPTVQYAIGFNETQNTWWTNPLSLVDLKIDSPYNTYVYTSFPPGPISSPTLNALRAVAFPAQTPYYYFRAGCDQSGKHLFAETFQEHLNNACP
jgi:UPF0755 protein